LALSLNKMSENLQRQISERETAEHASETKNLFLANMSHEIRTPLSAILGFSELLADPDLPKKDRENFHAIIRRTGASLTAIINDIIDVSKVEAEKLEIELKPFSLSQLLDDLQAVLHLRSSEKGIQLRFSKIGEVSPLIESDPARLRQILANVIGNSIKFTERGSVEVIHQVKGRNLVFTVIDSGAGIPKDQIGNLFTPFSQGDASARKKYGGTGLGLLISKKLAELLGGDVVLEKSVPGKGSTFSISIAYNPREQLQASPLKAVPVDQEPLLLRGRKVLVVEDSPDNQLLTQLYLVRAGAEVQFANDGEEAIEKASKNLYDLILMDIQMPHMDGYTATRVLRDRGYGGPIVALTGYAMREDAEKCMRAGCDGYLTKPFDRKTLVESVLRYASDYAKSS
jgi:two-component system, sensor histidine kinase